MIIRDVILAVAILFLVPGLIFLIELWRTGRAMKKRDKLWENLDQAWREIDNQIEEEKRRRGTK